MASLFGVGARVGTPSSGQPRTAYYSPPGRSPAAGDSRSPTPSLTSPIAARRAGDSPSVARHHHHRLAQRDDDASSTVSATGTASTAAPPQSSLGGTSASPKRFLMTSGFGIGGITLDDLPLSSANVRAQLALFEADQAEADRLRHQKLLHEQVILRRGDAEKAKDLTRFEQQRSFRWAVPQEHVQDDADRSLPPTEYSSVIGGPHGGGSSGAGASGGRGVLPPSIIAGKKHRPRIVAAPTDLAVDEIGYAGGGGTSIASPTHPQHELITEGSLQRSSTRRTPHGGGGEPHDSAQTGYVSLPSGAFIGGDPADGIADDEDWNERYARLGLIARQAVTLRRALEFDTEESLFDAVAMSSDDSDGYDADAQQDWRDETSELYTLCRRFESSDFAGEAEATALAKIMRERGDFPWNTTEQQLLWGAIRRCYQAAEPLHSKQWLSQMHQLQRTGSFEAAPSVALFAQLVYAAMEVQCFPERTKRKIRRWANRSTYLVRRRIAVLREVGVRQPTWKHVKASCAGLDRPIPVPTYTLRDALLLVCGDADGDILVEPEEELAAEEIAERVHEAADAERAEAIQRIMASAADEDRQQQPGENDDDDDKSDDDDGVFEA